MVYLGPNLNFWRKREWSVEIDHPSSEFEFPILTAQPPPSQVVAEASSTSGLVLQQSVSASQLLSHLALLMHS